MDWNSDGEWDIISGDRSGYFNVFIREDTILTGYYRYRLIDSTIIDVGNNSQPAVTDWNGDGKKDLILGSEAGYIYLFLNQTSDTWPMFQDYTYLQAGGQIIYIYRVNPYIFDLDRDGKKDLICGENNGYVHFFKNIGSDSNPILTLPETLKMIDGTPVRPSPYPYGSRCGFGYWNNDTLPDFLLGSYDGQIRLYLGVPFVNLQEDLPFLQNEFSLPSISRLPIKIKLKSPKLTDNEIWISNIFGEIIWRWDNLSKEMIEWDGRSLKGRKVSKGVYFLNIRKGKKIEKRQIILIN
ncbi:MAG: VCBS repeat-containing protein [candidate division WOR-3 bacterium]|nr:VCBS repeat-containing protein [candidate division WOR-3 bacterium]MDW8113566.1 VCBS repeat-containing protein [candidate division WOR-3 bacterium]